MIAVSVDTARQQIWIRGHDEDPRICGCLTALLRAYGTIATRARFAPGDSAIELDFDYPEDWDALLFGVETILAKSNAAIISYDTEDLKQIA